jgi:hypothetical protein
MAKSLKRGDRVTWDTSQGETTGKVVRKLTKAAKVKGHAAKASPEAPQYLVRSEKSGKQAIHKPRELKKR